MTIYFPYGLVAIGMSMYIFYRFRKRRKEVLEDRAEELKTTRQMWLESTLGKATFSISLVGPFMEQKIQHLTMVGHNDVSGETYFIDHETGEKWIKSHLPSAVDGEGEPQLRKVSLFPYE